MFVMAAISLLEKKKTIGENVVFCVCVGKCVMKSQSSDHRLVNV